MVDLRLFELARRGRRLTHPLAALVLAPMIILIGGLIGGAASVLLLSALLSLRGNAVPLSRLLQSSAPAQTLSLAGTFLPIIALVLLWVWLYEGRQPWTLGLERRGAVWRAGRGLLVGMLLYTGALGICAALGYVSALPAASLSAAPGVLLILVAWLVQGSAEELVCRGWLMPVVGARTRPWLGLLLSALIFAVLHSLNPNVTPLAILNLVLFGLFAGLYALHEGSVWGIGALHGAWNWTQGSLFGIVVSGSSFGPSLLQLKLNGPALITGGAFGSEGGLAVTAVMLLGCAVLLWRLRGGGRTTSDQ